MIANYTEEKNESYIVVAGQQGRPFKITTEGKIKHWFGGFIRLRKAFISLVSALVTKFDGIRFEINELNRENANLRNLIIAMDKQIWDLTAKIEKKKNARNSR